MCSAAEVSAIAAGGQHEASPRLAGATARVCLPGQHRRRQKPAPLKFSEQALANTSPAVRGRVAHLCVSKCLRCRHRPLPATSLRAGSPTTQSAEPRDTASPQRCGCHAVVACALCNPRRVLRHVGTPRASLRAGIKARFSRNCRGRGVSPLPRVP